MYRFIPNDFGRKLFHLPNNEYIGDGITNLMQNAIGKDNYNLYLPAQDPIPGDKPGEGVVYTNEGTVFGKIIRDA